MADLSVLSVALSGLSLLLSIALLSILSILTLRVTELGKAIEEQVSLCGTKLSFIEFRLDRATASASDGLRHLVAKLNEFDPQIGSLQVLKKWISTERDSWLLRRTAQGWLALSAAAEYSVLNELIYLRITEGADPEAEQRILSTLKQLPKLLAKGTWLSTEDSSFPSLSLSGSEEPVMELLINVTEHREYLKDLSTQCKKDWGEMTQGLVSIHAKQPEEQRAEQQRAS
jgi:hypothetical protein